MGVSIRPCADTLAKPHAQGGRDQGCRDTEPHAASSFASVEAATRTKCSEPRSSSVISVCASTVNGAGHSSGIDALPSISADRSSRSKDRASAPPSATPGIGMHRVAEEFLPLGRFHQPATAHHGNPVGHVVDNRQIVRDEQVCQAEFLLQVFQQIQHLRLNGDVQRRDRLIADQQFGLQGQGAGDADTLSLTA